MAKQICTSLGWELKLKGDGKETENIEAASKKAGLPVQDLILGKADLVLLVDAAVKIACVDKKVRKWWPEAAAVHQRAPWRRCQGSLFQGAEAWVDTYPLRSSPSQ